MSKIVRIGTRDSKLAVWQANHVAGKLAERGVDSRVIHLKSEGDLDLTTPLVEMGGKGVFTKTLDDALIRGKIDLAVHSFKDLPTENPLPLKVAAVLEREDPRDALVAPKGTDFLKDPSLRAVIASSSHRRRSQWLHRFPDHTMENIRGNVQTRLRKVHEEGWDGAIFAAAGLKRVNLEENISEYLDWMVPAPAQGAIAVMIREDDSEVETSVAPLRHQDTALCTGIERELLNRMEAGCSAPVGAYAHIEDGIVTLQAVALTLDGSLQYDIEMSAGRDHVEDLGRKAADALLEQGADKIIEDLKKESE